MMNDYTTLRAMLEDLAIEFEQQFNRGRRLCHDLVFGPDGEAWSEKEFAAFVHGNANASDIAWEEWRLWPSREACSRYWGALPWDRQCIRCFEQLARRGYLTLMQLIELSDFAPVGFRGCGYTVPPRSSEELCSGWLSLMHEWAYRFPVANLTGDCPWWGLCDTTGDEDEIAQRMTTPVDGGVPFHTHPICHVLNVDVFTASIAFIEICLEPDQLIEFGQHDGVSELYFPQEMPVPCWLPDEGEFGQLWFEDSLIKAFEKKPDAQAIVLNAFEKAGWPSELKNPALVGSTAEYHVTDWLRQTVQSLNERHSTHGLMKFGTRDERRIVTWNATE